MAKDYSGFDAKYYEKRKFLLARDAKSEMWVKACVIKAEEVNGCLLLEEPRELLSACSADNVSFTRRHDRIFSLMK